jgi:aspartyl-tRNA(Asn)/glutamyl-tRNA(Gln) amidotransferase subunit B
MLRQRPRGTIRLLDRLSRPVTRPQNLYLQFRQFSSLPTRSAPTPTSSVQPDSDRVPLRKQLKQEAKALKAQKRQRKESEEASREIWELTVGVEIHAQLDTTAKLFSRMSTHPPYHTITSLAPFPLPATCHPRI